MNIYITEEAQHLRPELEYLLRVFEKNKNTSISFSSQPSNAISIGFSNECKIVILSEFAQPSLSLKKLNEQCLFTLDNGHPDYFSTAFYMLSSQQEVQEKESDALGRFKYSDSYQFKFKNAKDNIVQYCFDKIGELLGLHSNHFKSSFFLSHDIDTVNGAIIEDGFNVIKRGRIDLFIKFLFNIATGKPDWLNIDKILKIESEYDCKSTFFWLVNQGIINEREKNADYDFKSTKISKHFEAVHNTGFENGIHKSISSDTFQQEIEKYGTLPLANRYHYLKFRLPEGFEQIEQARLKMDASLGFAEEIGFRSSYGLPYNPFNFKTRSAFNFIETPLNIMDRTFFQYKRYTVADAEKDIFDFFEKNKYNAVISVLWHNNFFTNYKFKGYLNLYKKILTYIHENNLDTLNSQEIVRKYSIY